ncbi:MAG TPA: transcription antitermination factor NusB [Clostridiales bacterium]|nr:transcription antitermination factor NusB [Clostridiales bacterium]
MKMELSRRQAREQAFILAFERQFNNDTTEELCLKAEESRDFQIDDFTLQLINNLTINEDTINGMIEKNSNGWKISRMSKVSLSLLQLAICEMLYVEDITKADNPVGVAINEAVVLAKKYSTAEDASFINGVLGTIAKEHMDETV